MPWRFVLIGRRSKPRPLIGPLLWGRGQCGWHGRWESARQKQPDTDCKGWRERAIEGEEGREDRRVDFMMQGLDLHVPVWCYVCVCRFEDAVIHMGVVSEAGVIFFFCRVWCMSLQLEQECVCVCWPSRRQGVVQLYYHPPTLPPSPWDRVRTMWGVKWQGRESERRFGRGWSGGETSAEWMALFAWPCLCCGPLSFSCSLAWTQHTASVLSAPLSPWPYSNKCLHCSLRLNFAAQPFYSSSSCLFYNIMCSFTAITVCVFPHSTDLQGKNANICLLRPLNHSPCTGVW